MGGFYTNITLRGPEQARVAGVLRQADRSAYISPVTNGFTVVFDERSEEQDTGVLSSLASALSAEFGCATFAVLNHDDDILWYSLHNGGKALDEYHSAPGYFDPEASTSEPAGGDAGQLCDALGATENVAEVEAILRKPAAFGDDDYVFESERHDHLARALGLPVFSVGLGFTYVREGDVPEGLDFGDLIRTP